MREFTEQMFDLSNQRDRAYACQMPLYEYRCNDCSAVFELLRPMADREVAAVCPSCESRASMPLISRVAVHRRLRVGRVADR